MATKKKEEKKKHLYLLALSAVGVVYGDIGTSPLYAIRECFHGSHSIPVNNENVLGVLSLVLWSLIIIVSIKYLIIVLKADNEGEGGILALMETVLPKKRKGLHSFLMILGFFGAALLYGDGIITPAISVLSAVEGLKVATPVFEPYIIPITIAVLFGLFFFQKSGTAGVGAVFGPVMCFWFVTIAVLGGLSIAKNPEVFKAINPVYAYDFFSHIGMKGLFVLGAVFLVVTGGEALYADLGHFGTTPIRFSWFSLVLPCLLINYFGQGALLLQSQEAAVNPFYHMSPHWMLYPLVVLATAATIIASQAVISGAFSLTFQAVQLGYLPRMNIRHTSETEIGQVYLPQLNWVIFAATALLVMAFQTSSNLAAAYGVAVSTTMVITDILLFVTMRNNWKWAFLTAFLLMLFFLLIDLGYLVANFIKIVQGGWVPLVIAGTIFMLMSTWRKGRKLLSIKIGEIATPIKEFVSNLPEKSYHEVEGTAVYLSSHPDHLPPALEHNLQHNKVLHSKIIFLEVEFLSVPRAKDGEKWEIEKLDTRFIKIKAKYGYRERINLQYLMQRINKEEKDLELELNELTYFLGRETLIPKKEIGMYLWRAKLFQLLSVNAQDATKFFNLPSHQVFEVGKQVKM